MNARDSGAALDLDELERAANAIRPDQRGVPAFSAENVLALIARLREVEREREEAREKLAAWMIERSFATGHGDTLDDLLSELAFSVAEIRAERDRLKAELDEAVGVIRRWAQLYT